MSCYGCKCNLCARSCELYSEYITIGEVDECCFTCDECKHFGNDWSKRSQWRKDCDKYLEPAKLAAMRAEAYRKKFKVIQGGPANNCK